MEPISSREYNALFDDISRMIDGRVRARMQHSRIVLVVSTDGPVVNDAGVVLPPDTFYISKSIDVNNLHIGDRLLLTETVGDMPVITDLIRTQDDMSDARRIKEDLQVDGEIIAKNSFYADNGIIIKTFSEKSPPVDGVAPSDDDFDDPPVGTLSLDLRVDPPVLYVRTAPGVWKVING